MAVLSQFTDWPWRHWAAQRGDATALYFSADSLANSCSDSCVDSCADIGTESTEAKAIQSLSWYQLNQRIEQYSCSFVAQGVLPGHGVVLRGKNSLDLLLCQLALITCGARVLPLNPRLPIDLLAQLLPRLNIDFVIEFDSQPTILTTDSVYPATPCRTLSYPALTYDAAALCTGKLITSDAVTNKSVSGKVRTDNPLSQALPPCDLYRPATLILTSGSTGLPKAAVHHTAAHLLSAKGVLGLLTYQPQDCWLLSLPLFHVSGQGIVWRWLLRGAILAIKPSMPLAQALQGVTHASLVPTQLWRLLAQPEAHLQTLHDVLLGGAAIPTELTDAAQKQGIRCWSGYGMTEMASTICAKRADGKPGVGLPLMGKKVRLVDGEIQICADSQALGYWFDHQIVPLKCLSSEKPMQEDLQGWFATNDKGAFIDGEYQILGRLDNLFFSGGEGIQPEDIEAVIASHPQVTQCFVVPRADIEFGHRPVAVIEGTTDLCLEQLQIWLKPKLAVFQYPVAFYWLDEQLKSGGIKISRQAIKRWVAERP
ncbi:o-succinylbenzoate--CoA ligase [Moellerella wisconsensis]|uniref:o-succinylbenzoate--CoA ligase n=1 Tax=Moellerella wisconsensis TaxID=158849 RepID=UPI0025AEFE1A|nr:o-succinylbenzoate--CoA ligase [Moellerella wisconsensis]WJW80848.1 o-succinylbenzoate--CoA ligase [Moellerella wisconsensis]